jgi:hypothetical protein
MPTPRPPAALLVAAALTLAALPAGLRAQGIIRGGDGEYTARRDTTIDAHGARRVDVEGRSGELRVVGVAGLREVRVRGTARASRERWLDELRVEARRDGDVVRVRADIPDRAGDDWGGDMQVRALDLVIEVPQGIDADVRDGSGAVEIRGVGALTLVDGSGEVRISDVGSADVEDGSGEVRIDGVRGDVHLADGSGSLIVTRVGGAVHVDRDGSGEVDVRDVAGDLVVRRSRAAGVQFANVRGRVDVPEARHTRAARRTRWY